MMHTKPSMAQEVARRDKEIYEREIRAKVEPEQEGRFLVVDVNSGRYALADDELEPSTVSERNLPTGFCTWFVSAARPPIVLG